MKQKIANSPDFAGVDPDEAMKSLQERITKHRKSNSSCQKRKKR